MGDHRDEPALRERPITTNLHDLPRLGVGLGFRLPLAGAILEHRADVDWLEIITDHFIRRAPSESARAADLKDVFPLVPHGLEMSIGSAGPLDQQYLEEVATLAEAVDAPWVSDHLCFTREGGVELGTLTPVVRTRENAVRIAGKAQEVQDRLGRPFLMENITYYVDMPAELSEADFIAEVFEHCDCGLLLDLTNLVINCRNRGLVPREVLHRLPLDRVVQVHVAGGHVHDGVMIDSHSAPVPDEVWELLTELDRYADLKAVLLERDDDFPEDFQELLDELGRARAAVGWGDVKVGAGASRGVHEGL